MQIEDVLRGTFTSKKEHKKQGVTLIKSIQGLQKKLFMFFNNFYVNSKTFMIFFFVFLIDFCDSLTKCKRLSEKYLP